MKKKMEPFKKVYFICFYVLFFIMILANFTNAANVTVTQKNYDGLPGIQIKENNRLIADLKSMPQLAEWINKDKNTFFDMDVAQFAGKKIYTKRDDSGEESDKKYDQGGTGALNGMCLYEHKTNKETKIPEYTIYNVIDISFEKDKGYVANLTTFNNGNSKTIEKTTKSLYISRLIYALKNVEGMRTPSTWSAKAAVYKNEPKYYLYYLRDWLGLNNNNIQLQSSQLEWLKNYAEGGEGRGHFSDSAENMTDVVTIQKDGKASVVRGGTGVQQTLCDKDRFTQRENNANRIKNYKIRNMSSTKAKVVQYQQDKTIIGPFKINYDGANISGIQINGQNQTEVEYSTSSSSGWKNLKGTLPKEQNFYLRINNSSYNNSISVKICLVPMNYYKLRAVVGAALNADLQPCILWSLKEDSVSESREWVIEMPKCQLTINKLDYDDDSKRLDEAEFAIFFKRTSYTESKDVADGWLGGSDNTITYGNNWSSHRTFRTSNSNPITLNQIFSGRYYVIEIKAPRGYLLSCQPGYKETESFMEQNNWKMTGVDDWCIIGETSRKSGFLEVKKGNNQENTTIANYVHLGYGNKEETQRQTYNIKNIKGKNLLIYKRSDENKKMSDVGMKVLVKLKGTDNWKWISNDNGGHTTRYSEAYEFYTDSNGRIKIKNAPNGTYYIFETSIPDKYKANFDLSMQPTKDCGYPRNDIPSDVICCVTDPTNIVIDGNDKSTTVNIINYKKGSLTINKTDVSGKLISGAEFKILVKRNDGKWRWISKTDNGFSYVVNPDNANAWPVNKTLKIKGLGYGTYYIFETKAPDEYELKDQNRYRTSSNDRRPTNYNGEMPSGEYAYPVNSQKIEESNKDITFNVKNKKDEITNSLEIIKKDRDTGDTLEQAGFRILMRKTDDEKWYWIDEDGNLEKVEDLEEKGINPTTNPKYELKTNEDGIISLTDIPLGSYFVYETTAPNGYELSKQVNNSKTNGQKGKPITYSGPFFEETVTYVYYGKRVDIEKSNRNETIEMYNIKTSPSLNIIKKDGKYEVELKKDKLVLQGAHIKIYYEGKSEKGWISQRVDEEFDDENDITEENDGIININEFEYLLNEDSDENAVEFITDDDGKIEFKLMPLGKYEFYETETPDKYVKYEQPGYDEENDRIYLGSQTIDENNYNATAELTNEKIISSINGKVWVDNPNGKLDNINNLYDENGQDELLEGVTVQLYKGSTLIAEEKTDEDGKYSFRTKNRTENTDEKISYWELPYCHIQFIYDNREYIVVKPFENGESSIGNNSKAQPKEIINTGGVNSLGDERDNKGELYDGNLKGTEEIFYGKASTFEGNTEGLTKEIIESNSKESIDKRFLTGFFNENNFTEEKGYTINDINLGLIKKTDPTFEIDKQIELVKVVKGNYRFTYKYDDNALADIEEWDYISEKYVKSKKTQAEIAYQNSARTFTQYVYPSDIEENFAEENKPDNDKFKVYVVYKVSIRNNTTTELPEVYDEKSLKVISLTDTFDSTRYDLNKDNIGYEAIDNTGVDENLVYIEKPEDAIQLWGETVRTEEEKEYVEVDGTIFEAESSRTKYSKNIELEPNHTSVTYIQFKVRDETLKEILKLTAKLDGSTEEMAKEINENIYKLYKKVPTRATAVGYHTYERNDYTWKNSGVKTHYTKNYDKESAALGIIWRANNTRTISGSVFEDEIDEGRSTEKVTVDGAEETIIKERIGNGKRDDGENAVRDVVVSLIDTSNNQVAKVYDGEYIKENEEWVSHSNNAITKVKDDGTYSIPGVVPGNYYLRFTYGNGEVKVKTLEGENIDNLTSKTLSTKDDVEQWIDMDSNLYKSTILTGNAKNVNDSNEKTWFLQNDNYSVATDRQEFIDKRIAETNKNEELNYSTSLAQELINADSPKMDIQFEYQDNNSIEANNADKLISDCTNMSFGIIERPHVDIQLDKKIKNIKFTLQNGTTIINGNPNDSNLSANLFKTSDNFAKIELDKSNIYGSEVSVTYQLTAHNESELDYATTDYYKYGNIDNEDSLVKTTVTKIIEYVENQNAKFVGQSSNVQFASTFNEEQYLSPEVIANNKKYQNKVLEMQEELTPKLANQENSDSKSYELTVNNLLSSSDDVLGWQSFSEIIGISNITKTPQSVSKSGNYMIGDKNTHERDDGSATITVYSSTGENRNNAKYIIISSICLILAVGIIIIKKKMKTK